IGGGENVAVEGASGSRRMAGLDLATPDETPRDAKVFKSSEPPLIIRACKIDVGWQQFDPVASNVDIPLSCHGHNARHGEHSALPCGMEYRLIGLGVDLAKAIHTTHVVDAVHRSSCRALG